ncbi:MAG: hypothetical protein AAF270_02455 [Pseudomonadota bacterium]
MVPAIQTIVDGLQFGPTASDIWLWLVRLCAAYLVGLGMVVFWRRSLALRFLGGFAATLRANTLESVLRFAAGIAFLGASPAMRTPGFFVVFGTVLAVSALGMLLLPGAHKRYASWAVPLAQRIATLLGTVSIILGLVIGWATLR